MHLAVISDTHGHILNTKRAVGIIESFTPAAVLHCGDIGSAEIPNLLANWPTHYVIGNVDSKTTELETAIEKAGGIYHQDFGDITIHGKRIALLHSHLSGVLESTIESELFDIVCYGHTHHAEFHMVQQTFVVNPGALFRAKTHTIAILDIQQMPIRAWHVDVG